jgi:ketosteroid isomerase-like protein
MTDTEKKTIAESFIAALRHRDRPALADMLTEDIVWGLPGDTAMSGEARGVDAILKRAETLASYGVSLEILHVVYGLRDVALHLHNTGTRDGKVLDEYLTTVCHLSGDKIARLDTYISDVPMLNTYFGVRTHA